MVTSLCTAQKMKFSIKDFYSKCDQICGKLRIWSHLLKKSWMENFIFCAVSLLILSEFKRINFGSPWNHQKTYCTRSKIWKRSHSEMSNIFISISFKAKIENVALFFILFCKTLKTFAMEISIFLKYFSTPPPVP